MRVINPAVGCHYFPPGLQLPSQPLRGLLPFRCLVNRGTIGVNSLPKTVTRQRRGCDLNPGPSAPESSTLTTRLPSHPKPTCTNRNYNKKTTLAGCEKSLLLTKNCFMQLDKNYSPGIDCPPLHHSRRRTSRTWHRRDRDRGGKLGHRPCRRRRRRPSCMCGSDTSAGS